MLGFNKYLIPFQMKTQSLPFNVAALGTVKYDKEDFESEASKAIEIAIEKTKQGQASLTLPNQLIELFLLSKKALYSTVDNEGEKTYFAWDLLSASISLTTSQE